MIDMQGGVLFPGFTDAHTHPVSGHVSRQDHQSANVFQPFGVSAKGVAAAAKDAVDWNITTIMFMTSLCIQLVRLPVGPSQGVVDSQLDTRLGVGVHLHVGVGDIIEGHDRVDQIIRL